MSAGPYHDTPAPTSQKPRLCTLLGRGGLNSNSIDQFCLFIYFIHTYSFYNEKQETFFFFFKEWSLITSLFLLVQITPPRCPRSSSRTGSGSWAASLKPSVLFTTRERGHTTLPRTFLVFGVPWSSNWRTTPPVLPGTRGSSSKP